MMFRAGLGLFSAALLIAALPIPSKADNRAHQDGRNSEYSADQSAGVPNITWYTPFPSETRNQIVPIPTYYLEYQAAANQQPNGFLWIPWDAWVAIFTAVLAGVSIWQGFKIQKGERLTNIALRSSQRQARAAIRAAHSANAQVSLSKTALVTTERAFIFCERVEPHWKAQKETDKIISWVFTPKWKNSGKTPPSHAVSCTNHWIGVDAGTLPEAFEFPDYATGRPTMIGPGAIMHAANVEIPIDTLLKMREGTAHAYIWGWFDYNDVFEGTERHRTEYCFEIFVTANPIYKEGGFAFRMHGPFNGYDSECYREPAAYPGKRT